MFPYLNKNLFLILNAFCFGHFQSAFSKKYIIIFKFIISQSATNFVEKACPLDHDQIYRESSTYDGDPFLGRGVTRI